MSIYLYTYVYVYIGICAHTNFSQKDIKIHVKETYELPLMLGLLDNEVVVL